MNVNHVFKKSLLLFTYFFIAIHADATRRYVVAGNPFNNGLSWNTASGDLQQIIALSVAGDEIWVAEGTYKPLGAGRSESFLLKEGVKIYGGFLGVETSLTQRNLNNYFSILSGNIDLAGNNDCYHVVRQANENIPLSAATVLDGFTIRDGYNEQVPDFGSWFYAGGAGIYLLANSSPVITNCIFKNNRSSIGAAILIDSRTIDGTVNFSGGNIHISHSVFDSNFVIHTGTLSLSTTDIYFANCNIQTDHCRFTARSSVPFSSIVGFGGDLNFTYSAMTNLFNNGSIFINEGILNIENSVFDFSNTISAKIYSNNVFKIKNSTMLGSDQLYGGDSLEIKNCIFYGANPFEILVENYTVVDISHSIAKKSGNCAGFGCPEDVDERIVYGNYCPGNQGNVDPLFVNAADPDGPDNTLGTSDDGLRLQSNSPAHKEGTGLGVGEDITGTAYNPIVSIGAYQSAPCFNGGLSRLYVNEAVSGGNGMGDSWANAMPNIRTALAAASTCNAITEIWVANGKYETSAVGDRDQYLYLRNNMAVYGGFVGTETNINQRNLKRSKSVLSGDIATGANDAHRIMMNRMLNNTAVLDGFILTGANSDTANGAGMRNISSHPTIRNCVIKYNSTGGEGGGMYNGNSDPVIVNCVFFKNISLGDGGGIFNGTASSPYVRNCVFASNIALNGNGGAVYNVLSPGTNRMINCTFYDNFAWINGKAIFNNFANPTITNCIFWRNGGTGQEIVNYNSSNPVVSYSHVDGGYSPCSNCSNGSLSPKFVDSTLELGPNGESSLEGWDGMFASFDDGLQLEANSPCINNGNNAVVVDATDIVGDARIVAATVNMGAYETIPVTSVQTGNWRTGSTWSINAEPVGAQRIIIKPNHTVTIDASYNTSAKSMVIMHAGHLIIPVTSQIKFSE